jgi:acetyltransferase
MEFFFNPKSVAIVGASRNPMKFGSIIVANLFNLGYEGKIFPVNPKAEDIAGLKTYPSVTLIPDELDLAILAIPASATVGAMRDCAQKRVKGVVIISSGFKEAGETGTAYQRELLEIARGAGIRIIGPNTTGILNPRDRFTTTFVPLREVKQGSVAFIAQTGMFAGMLLEWILSSECFGVSKVVGLGNKCDVNDAEVLEYLAKDEHTKVIMMYVESIKDGRRFIEAAKATTRRKPIVVVKAGHTGEGAVAAMSHTGSLAGNDDIVSTAYRPREAARLSARRSRQPVGHRFPFGRRGRHVHRRRDKRRLPARPLLRRASGGHTETLSRLGEREAPVRHRTAHRNHRISARFRDDHPLRAEQPGDRRLSHDNVDPVSSGRHFVRFHKRPPGRVSR